MSSIDIGGLLTFIFGLFAVACVLAGLIFLAVARLSDQGNALHEGKMMGFFIAAAAATAAAVIAGATTWTYI